MSSISTQTSNNDGYSDRKKSILRVSVSNIKGAKWMSLEFQAGHTSF
jgi:hypothetical protein